jgi:hypothetical protein
MDSQADHQARTVQVVVVLAVLELHRVLTVVAQAELDVRTASTGLITIGQAVLAVPGILVMVKLRITAKAD